MVKLCLSNCSRRSALIGCCVYVALLTFLIVAALHRPTHKVIDDDLDKNVQIQIETVFGDDLQFFQLETQRDKDHLTSLEACSMESIARRHPDSHVTRFMMDSPNATNFKFGLNLVIHYRNVYFEFVNMSDMFAQTPLERWWTNDDISVSSFQPRHLSEALRLAVLYKHGGIYVNNDVIVLQPLLRFKNAIGLHSDAVVNSDVLSFEKFSPFLYHVMAAYVRSYSGAFERANGPLLFTRVLRQWCNVTATFNDVVDRSDSCNGVNIVHKNGFRTFEQLPNSTGHREDSYFIQMDTFLSDFNVTPDNLNSIKPLMQTHCPFTYQMVFENLTVNETLF